MLGKQRAGETGVPSRADLREREVASCLRQEQKTFATTILRKRFGAQRQNYQILKAVFKACTEPGALLSLAVTVQLRPRALAL